MERQIFQPLRIVIELKLKSIIFLKKVDPTFKDCRQIKTLPYRFMPTTTFFPRLESILEGLIVNT